jgi:hypothetical protein
LLLLIKLARRDQVALGHGAILECHPTPILCLITPIRTLI